MTTQAHDSWKEEKRSAYLYRALASIEKNPVHQSMFADLSNLAERQASLWEQKLRSLGFDQPLTFHPDLHARVIIGLVKCFGARAMRGALAAMKIRGMSVYHASMAGHPMPTSMEDVENQHHSISHGNNLRAAVFGINDGLVSNASLILGVSGAQAEPHFILISGIAGLLAGACSMAAGEYVSVRSQREMLEYQLELEKSELELYPEEEAAELALIYQARGVPKEDATRIASLLIQDPEKALDTLAREELGINPSDLVSPWGAAISSFLSFALGATIPLVPFFIGQSPHNLLVTILLTTVSLFTVGAVLSLFTQRSAIMSGLRMMLIGALAGAATYFVGSLFGVS